MQKEISSKTSGLRGREKQIQAFLTGIILTLCLQDWSMLENQTNSIKHP